jgi:carboxymethylenebutenolidase
MGGRTARTLAWALALILFGACEADAQSRTRAKIRGGVRASAVTYRSGDASIGVECFAPAPALKGKHPLVLLLHGSGGLEQDTGRLYQAFARGLAGKGFVVLVPHLFDRTDHVPGAPLQDGEYESFVEAVKDAIAFAAARDDVDAERVGIFGLSMGAGIALWEGMKDPRVKTIVLLSGPAGTGRTGVKLKLPPTLILHGEHDDSTPVSRIRKFDEVLADNEIPHELHVYRGIGHNFDAPRFQDVARRSIAFFNTHLKQPPPKPDTKARPEKPLEPSEPPVGSPPS